MSEQNQSQGQTQNVPKKKAWYKRWWVITLGVIILIAIIANSGKDNSGKQTSSDQSQPAAQEATSNTQPANNNAPAPAPAPVEPAKATPDVTVTSAVIAKDYSENEVAADAKYKGKLIEISGKIYGVDNGITDNEMIVRLSDAQYDINDPTCNMKASEHDKVVAFKKGQAVTLIGTGDSATLGSPQLKDCIVK